jgi:hypothetical protein
MNGNTRVFVANHIKLSKPIERMARIGVGGFANIYLAEVEFLPINSHQLCL